MVDLQCIVDLKETIEKMNVEFSQSRTKISELDAKVRQQEEGLFAAQKEMCKLQEENVRLGSGLKKSEEKCKSVQERLELAERRLAQFSQKLEAITEDLAQVNESNGDTLDVNSLPDKIMLEIFSYLMQNQLGQIARVCRRWNILTKSPALWKKVFAELSPSHKYQYTVTKSFINGLPSCVTAIWLDFMDFKSWIGTLDFGELCVKLQKKCPHLEVLIVKNSKISDSLPTVIDLCTQFLQCLKILLFNRCKFLCNTARGEFFGTSKLEVLYASNCDLGHLYVPPFSRMPCLKELGLYDIIYCKQIETQKILKTNPCLWLYGHTSFLNQLDVLDLSNTYINNNTFLAIQNNGHNLKELYVCVASLYNYNLNLNKSVFPHLKTICLVNSSVDCEGVVSLIQSCPSLQNVYVNENMAMSFAAHPFAVANRCKSKIVKVLHPWEHLHKPDYLCNWILF